MNSRLMILCGCLLVGLVGCGAGEADKEADPFDGESIVAAAGPLVVYAVNYPLAYFAERIGGSDVEVRFPVPAGEDPAYWNPTAEDISGFQSADIVLLNGAGYAGWTEKASLPRSKLVDTSANLSDRFVEADESLVHAHGPEGEHEHGTLAFTTWLDQTMAIEQARAIRDALGAERPDSKQKFDTGFASLEVDLLALDSALMQAAADLDGTPVVGSHPVYQYLAQRYGIDLRSVHFEPDQTPSDAGWQDLREIQRARSAPVMLWEAQPMASTDDRLKSEFGITGVVFSPCASRPDVDDYMGVMRENAQRLSAIVD